MYGFLLAIHLLVCLALVGVVLIQSGKGGGLAGGAFGGSAQTVFGGRGATDIVTRATMVLGGLFFLTSITLALMAGGQRGPTRSLIQQEAQKSSASQPAQLPAQRGGVPPTGGGQPPAGGTPNAPAPTPQSPGTVPSTPPAAAPSTPSGGGH